MDEDLLHEKIEAYLLGQLPADEVEAFASRIAADAGLAKQVEIQRAALLGLERLAERSLHAQFNRWDKTLDAVQPGPKSQSFWRWISAPIYRRQSLLGSLLAN